MKKDLLFAIATGSAFGFIVTALFWVIKNDKLPNLKPAPNNIQTQNQPPDETVPTPTPQEKTKFLKIDTPQQDTLTNKATISVTGQTTPGSELVILSELGDNIINTDEEGNFDQEIKLDGGLNTITVISFTPNGEEERETIYVTYSTAKI